MKKLFVLVLAIIFVLSFAAAAFAAVTGNNTESDWNPAGPTYRIPGGTPASDQRDGDDGVWDTGEGSPHTGYATTTNKCEVCHSPHQAGTTAGAGTSYKLLYGTTSASSDQAACEYCHTQGNVAIAQVYRNGASLGGHDLTTEDVPDSVAFGAVSAALKCSDCHTVHGANKIAGQYILKQNPSWNGVASGGAAATSTTTFCAKCHDMNHDTVINDDSHYMGAPNVVGSTGGASGDTIIRATSASTECASCHGAPDSDGSTGTDAKWPHQSLSIVGLGTGYSASNVTTQTAMDDHCLKCHFGVGTNY